MRFPSATILLMMCSLTLTKKCPEKCTCDWNRLKWICVDVLNIDQILTSSSHVVEILTVKYASNTKDWNFERFPSLQRLEFIHSEEVLSNALLKSLPQSARIHLPSNETRCGQALAEDTLLLKKMVVNFAQIRCLALRLQNVSDYLDQMQKMKKQCPPSCTCSPFSDIVSDTSDVRWPDIYIDCSNQSTKGQLKGLPSSLPLNFTISLNMNGNQVRDLTPLVKNYAVYKHVTVLHLQDNQVEDLSSVFQSKWFHEFLYLNLAGNKLQELDTHIPLVLYGSPRSVLLLARNPWTCRCPTRMNLQDLLLTRTYYIQDKIDVQCDGEPIRFLPPEIACKIVESSVAVTQLLFFRIMCIIIFFLSCIGTIHFYLGIWQEVLPSLPPRM